MPERNHQMQDVLEDLDERRREKKEERGLNYIALRCRRRYSFSGAWFVDCEPERDS